MAIVESDPLGQRPDLIHLLKKGVGDYVANESAQRQLHDTEAEIVAVVGALGSGKTTIVDLAIPDGHPRLKKIDTVTNRNRKDSDPKGFLTANEGITLESLSDEILRGDVMNYEVIEETGTIYATRPESMLGKVAVGPVATNCINQIINAFDAGRQRFVYLLTDPKSWDTQIKRSLGERHDSVKARLPETVNSLEFALDNIDLFTFIYNEHGEEGLQIAAQRLASIALRDGDHHSQPIITPAFVEETLESMLSHAQNLAKSIH